MWLACFPLRWPIFRLNAAFARSATKSKEGSGHSFEAVTSYITLMLLSTINAEERATTLHGFHCQLFYQAITHADQSIQESFSIKADIRLGFAVFCSSFA